MTSPRSRLSISEHRRSALAGLNNNNQQPTNGDSAMGDSFPPAADPRSSSRPRTSNGGSPILATTGDPHHHSRTPSLGELHQELEQEQEAQVNRLLHMIRTQQTQLQQLQHQQSHAQSSGIAVVDDNATTPQSERSASSFPPIPPLPPAGPRTSTQLSTSSHRRSRPSSQAASPNLRPVSSQHHLRGSEDTDNAPRRSSRDESAFYQNEANSLNRENQMLRQRIRDLERQLSAQTQSSTAEPSETAGEPANNEESAAKT